MTTATVKKTPAKAVKKISPITKESVAASKAVAAVTGEKPKKTIGKAADYVGWSVQELLAAGVTIEHDHETWKASIPPEAFSQYWEKRFTDLSEAHTECAAQIRGAHRKLYELLVKIKGLQESYDNPPQNQAENFAGSIERAIRDKLGRLGLLPKEPKYRDLFITVAIHPDDKLPDAQADKKRREAIQKKDSTYRKVFKEADRAGITAETMLPWLEEHGIESIRLGRWKTKKQQEADKAQADTKAAAEKARIDAFTSGVRTSQPRFSLPIEPKHIAWDAGKDHHEMVLLVAYRPTSGTLDVMHVEKGSAAFDAVVRVASKALPPAIEDDRDEEAGV